MSYLRNTFKYCFKNFFKLVLFILPAAFLMGFFINVYYPITFIKQFSTQGFASFSQIVSFYLAPLKGLGALYSIIAIIVFIITISVVCGAINYHMRTGKFSVKVAFKQSLHYMLPVLVMVLILIAILAILNFVGPSLIYFIYYHLGHVGTIPTPWLVAVATVIEVILLVLFNLLALIFVSAINSIVMHGYGFAGSLSRSVNLLDGKFVKLLAITLLPYVIILPSVLFISNYLIFSIVASILLVFQIMFLIVLIFVFYFDTNNLERSDNKKTYFNFKK